MIFKKIDQSSMKNNRIKLKDNYINDCIDIYKTKLTAGKTFEKCPHCNSIHIVKFGKMISRENKFNRFKCNDCNKTFSEVTGSPLSYSKKDISKWIMYIECMAKSMTLKEISTELKINIKTAFSWRHKILSAVEYKIMAKELSNYIQIDEIIMRRNLKGNKKTLVGKKSKKNSPYFIPAAETIRVLSCIDDSENSFLKGVDSPSIQRSHIDKILSSRIKPKSLICTVRNGAYISFAKQNKLKLNMYGSSKNKYKIGEIAFLDITKARRQGRNFIKYVGKFRGVATKYINHYLNLYVWEIKNKISEFASMVRDLFTNFLNSRRKLRCIDFKNVTLKD